MSTFAEIGGWPAVLGQLTAGHDLPADVARTAMVEILAGEASAAQIAAFIVALRMKGETVEELGGLLDAMVAASDTVPVPEDLAGVVVDTCGTGGDRSHTINVSTIAALVVAGAGAVVCKHGNRAASSACGSADVLEALGVAIDLPPEGVASCLTSAGIGFCFAPRFHAAMRHAGPTRRELGVPTVFNFLGPMANPARVRRQVLGVSDPAMADRMLAVLGANGAARAAVVYGHDGLDELTTTTTSSLLELRDGDVTTSTVDPGALGIAAATADMLRGGDAATNSAIVRRVVAGEAGPWRDIVVLNAAAGLMVADLADDLESGVALAQTTIDEGRAEAALERLVSASAVALAASAVA
jgi:anthranilate phosphoribosyltransferase